MPASAGSTIFGDLDVLDDGSKVVFATNATNFLVGAKAAGAPAWMKHYSSGTYELFPVETSALSDGATSISFGIRASPSYVTGG